MKRKDRQEEGWEVESGDQGGRAHGWHVDDHEWSAGKART